MDSLQAIQDATNLPDLTQMVPEDVMGMIDQGRNPDIHTRTFTNRLNGDNQQMRGQANNFDVRTEAWAASRFTCSHAPLSPAVPHSFAGKDRECVPRDEERTRSNGRGVVRVHVYQYYYNYNAVRASLARKLSLRADATV